MRRRDGGKGREGRAGTGEHVRYIEILGNIVALLDKGMKGRNIVMIVAERHQNRK